MSLYDIHDMVFCPDDTRRFFTQKTTETTEGKAEQDIKARAASLESQLQKARRQVLGDKKRTTVSISAGKSPKNLEMMIKKNRQLDSGYNKLQQLINT